MIIMLTAFLLGSHFSRNSRGAFSSTLCLKTKAARWKIALWPRPFFPHSILNPIGTPFSPPFVLAKGITPTHERGENAIAIREKVCAEFSNKYIGKLIFFFSISRRKSDRKIDRLIGPVSVMGCSRTS